jgi:sarcosine oxidase/L-pipecolate oxidase
VRSDYSDLHYASLAREAIEEWQTPLWSTHYAACGTVIMSSASHPVGSSYVAKALALNQSPAFLVDGVGAVELKGAKEFRERYSGGEEGKGEFEGMVGYFNGNCGYTTARSAMDSLCLRVREAGVTFRAEEVTQLVYEGKGDERDVIGVLTREGEVVRGDLVVLAAGGWSASLLPELGHELLATGQVVGTIQLEKDEIEAYQGPVTFCLDTGL